MKAKHIRTSGRPGDGGNELCTSEERVQALEMQIELLQKQLESLQGAGEELFLTPKEAAQLMRCSVQTII